MRESLAVDTVPVRLEVALDLFPTVDQIQSMDLLSTYRPFADLHRFRDHPPTLVDRGSTDFWLHCGKAIRNQQASVQV